MSKATLLTFCLLMSSLAFAGPKGNCSKKQTEVSCNGVKGAKRDSFCWKGKVADAKKIKICKTKKIANKKGKKPLKKGA